MMIIVFKKGTPQDEIEAVKGKMISLGLGLNYLDS